MFDVGMVGEEDASSSMDQFQLSSIAQRKFWRSASWSASRTAAHSADIESKDNVINVDPSGNPVTNGIQKQRFATPLTPRPHQNFRVRSCLPPLFIARRSLDEWPKAGSDDIGEWWGPPTPGCRDVNKGGDRLKLDMSVIQNNSGNKHEGLVKKDRILFFDKECSKVAEHIYLGGDSVAKDRDILKKNGITHVLNCVGFVCPEYFKSDFVYRTLWLQDSPSEDITSILYDVFDYFEDVREEEGRVFVHCCQGVSRSTSLVIAYLMWREGQSFDDAFQYVKDARSIADPNMGFACQLLQCQKRVHAIPLSPSSVLRVYRIAPHSPYDPLHLVPKMLSDPSPWGLDSRGAFIILVPSSVYVWVGNYCDFIMEREARGAVSQIVRYEKVQVPVHVIKEGEEPSLFWNIFSDFVIDKIASCIKHVDAAAKIRPSERRLESYDVDFEVFQKAIKGGFVPPVSSSETECETHLPARENSWSSLRRKFALGHMKEFVSVPKLVPSKLHSESRINNGNNNKKFMSDHSQSFSSSGSNTNSKCSSESPLESPLSLSSTSTLSNHHDFIEVNFSSLSLKSTSLPSQRSPISIAERRGSSSKCLRLPIIASNEKMQGSLGKIDDVTCFSFELEKGGKIVECENRANFVVHDYDKTVTNIGSCYDESNNIGGNDISIGTEPPNVLTEILNANCESEQPSLFSLPNLKKISLTRARNFDSDSAVVVLAPRADGQAIEDINIYIWIGKFFSFDESQINLSRKIGDIDVDEWNMIASEVLARIGLPKCTKVEIIKEGKEPEEFLEMLSRL